MILFRQKEIGVRPKKIQEIKDQKVLRVVDCLFVLAEGRKGKWVSSADVVKVLEKYKMRRRRREVFEILGRFLEEYNNR